MFVSVFYTVQAALFHTELSCVRGGEVKCKIGILIHECVEDQVPWAKKGEQMRWKRVSAIHFAAITTDLNPKILVCKKQLNEVSKVMVKVSCTIYTHSHSLTLTSINMQFAMNNLHCLCLYVFDIYI